MNAPIFNIANKIAKPPFLKMRYIIIYMPTQKKQTPSSQLSKFQSIFETGTKRSFILQYNSFVGYNFFLGLHFVAIKQVELDSFGSGSCW